MEPLSRLFERAGLPAFGLPRGLEALYGGDLGFAAPRVYANFVASVDGVAALPVAVESGALVSGGSEADRFVMGLLRACADAVLIGAGTFRKAPGSLWRPEAAWPAGAAEFAELRARRGQRPSPPLALVSASGELDVTQPALADAFIVTTPAGEARLRGRLPPGARVATIDRGPGGGPIRMRAVLALLGAEGLGTVLTEGGPLLAAELAADQLLDELFLTVAPALFGRFAGDARKSILDGTDLTRKPAALLSARRAGDFLFLRYGLDATTPAPPST
jgi:riboflavin biosynthesis pyrimidine reductase